RPPSRRRRDPLSSSRFWCLSRTSCPRSDTAGGSPFVPRRRPGRRLSTARLSAELPLGSPATFLGRDVGDAPTFAVCLQDGRTCAGRDQRRETLENATPQGKVVA